MSTPDHVQPFQLDRPNLRGRMVRLSNELNSIIARHEYPQPVAVLLAETLTLAVLLAGMLKYDGIFTLQAKGAGAVRTLVADITTGGAMRAYAQYDEEKLASLGKAPTARDLLGEGHIAFTVDQGEGTERYQGMVELQGETLADFIHHYFRQSEQIDTALVIAARHTAISGWQAGGIMLQRLPEQSAPVGTDIEDGWRRAMMLMSTATPEELTSPQLSAHDMLYRLFHEEEVRIYEPHVLTDKCRCSRERVEGVMRALTDEDVSELTANGPAEVRCEFCSRTYLFSPEELARLRGGDTPKTVH